MTPVYLLRVVSGFLAIFRLFFAVFGGLYKLLARTFLAKSPYYQEFLQMSFLREGCGTLKSFGHAVFFEMVCIFRYCLSNASIFARSRPRNRFLRICPPEAQLLRPSVKG